MVVLDGDGREFLRFQRPRAAVSEGAWGGLYEGGRVEDTAACWLHEAEAEGGSDLYDVEVMSI